MKKLLSAASAAVLVALVSGPALAQVLSYTDVAPSGERITVPVTPSKPLPVTGGGGGGGGAITAAASSFATGFSVDFGKLGDAACSTDNGAACDFIQLVMRTNQRTTSIIAALGSPFQAGGTVTANAGTNLNTSALALDATVVAMSAKLPAVLGSTTKAGSVSVTFASDQTLPAFAATPTFNCGTGCGGGSLAAGSNIIGKVTTDQTTHGTTDLVAADITKVAGAAISQGHGTAAGALRVELPTDGTGIIGNTAFGSTLSGALTNPTSTLTLTSTTTAYTSGQAILNNATAGSVTVPSFAIANTAGGAEIPSLHLSTNDTTSTAWGGQTINVDLWTAAPTFTNGDRGAWSPATGTASHIGTYVCSMSAEYGDGAYAECFPQVGNSHLVKLASGTSVFWTLKSVTGSGVTGASKVWTLAAEVKN